MHLSDIDARHSLLFSKEHVEFSLEHHLRVDMRSLLWTVFSVNMGSFLFGYDFGATSWMLVALEDIASDHDSETYVTLLYNNPVLYGIIASGSGIGACLVYLYLLYTRVTKSRKHELIRGGLFYAAGTALLALSAVLNWNTIVPMLLMLLGRLLYGVGIGISLAVVPAYVSEIAPTSMRGVLGSCMEVSIVTGLCTGYGVGAAFSHRYDWCYTFLIAMMIGMFFCVVCHFVPYSTRWLLLQNQSDEKLLTSLLYFYPDVTLSYVEQLKATSLAYTLRSRSVADGSVGEELLRPYQQLFASQKSLAALRIGIPIVIAQQMTGMTAVQFFAGIMMDEIYPHDTMVAVIGFGAVKWVGALLMLVLINKFGRKTLLLFGLSLLCVSLVSLALLLEYNNAEKTLILLSLYGYVLCYELSVGPVVFILLGELYPMATRTPAMYLSMFFNLGVGALVSVLVPIAVNNVTISVVFGVFAINTLLGFILILRILPETKDITLEDITQLLQNYNK